MTIAQYLAHLINTRHYHVSMLRKSTVASNAALLKRITTEELPALETVAHCLASPDTMPPIAGCWHRWILANLPTYQNNARENERANDAARKANRERRDDELAQIRKVAA